MDTNCVENRIRPLALTRKSALFAGHDEGAATRTPDRLTDRDDEDEWGQALRLP